MTRIMTPVTPLVAETRRHLVLAIMLCQVSKSLELLSIMITGRVGTI